MKTDEEVGERLRRASRMVRLADDPVEAFHRRETIKRRRERLAAGSVAMVLFVAAVGGSLFALHGVWGRKSVPTFGGAPVLGPGQYLFLQRVETLPRIENGGQVISPGGTAHIETWWATDGSGRIVSSEDEGIGYGIPKDGRFDAGQFPIESDVSQLSTDPNSLLAQLRQRSGNGGASPQPAVTPVGSDQTGETGGLWRAVKRLLEFPNSTPELRAAVIQVAQQIPGVHVVRDVTDPVGRSGDAVQITIEGATDRITFDRQTFQPLSIVSTRVDDQSAVTSDVFAEGIVGSIDERPSGDQWLVPEPK